MNDPVVFGPVTFERPASRPRLRFGTWVVVALLLLLAFWAASDGWRRSPVLAVIATVIYLEFALTATRITRASGRVTYSEALAQRLVPPLVELSDRAGCSSPRVVVRDGFVRAAGVRTRKGQMELILSREFLDRVNDRALRAVLAHEIIHIVRRDIRWVKIRYILSVAVASLAIGVGAGSWPAMTVPAGWALGWTLILVLQVPLSLFNRRIERRADLEGARLAEDPVGLADALNVANSFSEEARSRVFGPRPWRWLLFSPLSWAFPTHPPIAKRLAALETLSSARST